MEYLALFQTQTGAISFHRFLATQDVVGQLQPVPRSLSSSCGLAVRFTYRGDLKNLQHRDLTQIYEIKEGKYRLSLSIV